MTDGFGAITWWGFSPAMDLQEYDYLTGMKNLSVKQSTTTAKDLNILLIGAGDLRHVMLTMARAYRHTKRKLHFYILENNLELYARAMLFLTIALEPQNRMGLQEKTELFLELYGNISVRKQSAEYIERMATEFIKMVTDFDYLEKKLPIVDMSQLKYKERDFLEAIFKFWRNPAVLGIFEVSKYWDLRQRKLLGVRYDTRMNVFDWDYQMRLVQRDADIIHVQEYKSWRETGVAFAVREADYDVPNKTMGSGLVLTHEGEKHARRGYWGDILVSPYVALGIQCEEQSFFKKANKNYTKTSCHLAEYNVLSMFHELATRTQYVMPQPEEERKETEESKGPKLTEITEEEAEAASSEKAAKDKLLEEMDNEVNEELQANTADKKPLEEEYVPLPLEDVQITFLPLGTLGDMGKKSKYKKLFQIVYFSNSMVHLLQPELNPVFANKATVIVESARYMLELKLEQVKMFVEKVQGLGKDAGCKAPEKCNPEKANFIKMPFERNLEPR